MTKELSDLIQYYNDNPPKNGLILKIRTNEMLKDEIFKLTSFLPTEAKLSERIYCIENNIFETQLCSICGKPLKFRNLSKGYYGTCGDIYCKNEKAKQGCLKGLKERDWKKSIEKQKQTCMERYGHVSNFYSGSDSMKKYKETMIQKYGSESPLKNDDLLAKAKQTCLDKYGVNNYTKTKEYLEKTNDTILKKYGSIDNYQKLRSEKIKKSVYVKKTNTLIKKIIANNYEVLEYNPSEKYFKLKCPKCGKIIDRVYRQNVNYYLRNNLDICPKCGYHETFRSNFEKDVVKFISESINFEIQLNRKYLGTEIDILIPEKKLAIECNGVYWHSELNKDKDYHISKKKLIEGQGFNLIQIWEDDWNDESKRKIIISRLKSKLGLNDKIYARKCVLKNIDGHIAKSFLDENHLQKYCPSSINLGLFYNNELVSIATFIQKRKTISGNRDGYELLRFCNKININVIGGFSKLISYFANNYSSNIFSYSDCDWCPLNDNAYSKIGFKQIKITDPNYWWAVNNIRKNRLNYTKKILVENGADPSKTEEEIMHEKRCYKVYGSGNILFKYKNKRELN